MTNPALLAAIAHLYQVESYPDSEAYAWPPVQRTPEQVAEGNRLFDISQEWYALAREKGWDGESWPWDDRGDE